MDTTPYWFASAKAPKFPKLEKPMSTEVLVVGAGVTGLLTAYFLQKAGVKTVVVERETIASRDSGHTTAHLTGVTDKDLPEIVKEFGRESAMAIWDAGFTAVDEYERIVRGEEIDCEFCRVPAYLHAPFSGGQADERKTLKKHAQLATEMGFDAVYLDRVPFMEQPGVRFSNQAKFHPLKFLFRLAQITRAAGVPVFENSGVTGFDAKQKRAKIGGQWVNYDRVVLATHTPLLGESSVLKGIIFQTKLYPYSTYVIGAEIPRGAIPIASFWDMNDPYQYLRVERGREEDLAILGGEDHKTGQARNPETIYRRLERAFLKMVPQAQVKYHWSGQVILTNDGLPYIGPNEHDQFIGTGYLGNGYTFGMVAALMARDWITGVRNPWRDLFKPERKKVRGGTWEYLRENKDYPYLFLKDRLGYSQGETLRAVKADEGKILKIDGKRLAVFRSGNGRVTKLSAVCTHMGCIVHWNQAEKTWDCPCHGSRFAATGEVLAGPAETSLPPAGR